MPKIYNPIQIPQIQAAPDPLGEALNLITSLKKQKMEEQQAANQAKLYDLQSMVQAENLRQRQIEFARAEKKQAAKNQLGKEMADLRRMGTDEATLLGTVRNRAYELDPDLGNDVDTKIRDRLTQSVQSRNAQDIALTHNALYPNDPIAVQDVEKRYFPMPVEKTYQPGATIEKRSALTGEVLSTTTTPKFPDSIQEMIVNPATREEGLALFDRMERSKENPQAGIGTNSRIIDQQIDNQRQYVNVLGAQLDDLRRAMNNTLTETEQAPIRAQLEIVQKKYTDNLNYLEQLQAKSTGRELPPPEQPTEPPEPSSKRESKEGIFGLPKKTKAPMKETVVYDGGEKAAPNPTPEPPPIPKGAQPSINLGPQAVPTIQKPGETLNQAMEDRVPPGLSLNPPTTGYDPLAPTVGTAPVKPDSLGGYYWNSIYGPEAIEKAKAYLRQKQKEAEEYERLRQSGGY